MIPPLAAPVSAEDALRRIGYLLERQRAGSYRVEAFRKASRTVRSMADDELEGHWRSGTLTDIDGVGTSTAEVIEQAFDGRLPDRLTALQESESRPLADGGQELFAALKGDCHSHTDWSDGGSPLDEMVLTAVELQHEWLVVTDHSPRLKVANGLSADRLARQLDLIDAVNAGLGDSIRVIKGIEVDILDDGSLDQSPEMLERLELVTASVHSKLKMDAAAMTRRMVAAVENPRTNVLGHCTGRLVTGGRGTRPQSQFDARAVFEACSANSVAVEINSRPERCDPPDELIGLALEVGCLFAIDSDAHAPGQLEMKAYGCERAERLGVPWERIVTTWDAADLLAWADGR